MGADYDNRTSTTDATSTVANEAAMATSASPQETTAEAPSAAAGEVAPKDAKVGDSGPRKTKAGKKPSQPTANGHNQRRQRQGAGAESETAAPTGIRERLLARFDIPSIALDRDLLPDALLSALDAAGLGRADLLASSGFVTMASIAAVAGPSVAFAESADPKLGEMLGTGSSLRNAMIGHQHAGPVMPGTIMAALYAVENDLVAAHEQSVERVASLRRVAADRRRLHDQAARAAAVLGLAPPPALSEQTPPVAARPRIVLVNGASSAVVEAAGGGTGVIVVDNRWMKSMTAGQNRDRPTADLLNALALGHAVPVVDPRGRTEMRALPACVIGVLAPAECLSLQRACSDQLAGTVFVNAVAAPVSGDGAPLMALMRQIHGMTLAPVTLHLGSKARRALVAATDNWSAIEAQSLAPLSDFVAGLPDLARRLAGVLHLAECAAADATLTADVPLTTVKRAVALVERFVLPSAQAILGPVSCREVERDARLMVAHLRLNTDLDVTIARRPWMRNWQNLMPLPRFDAALNLLLQEKLLTPTEGDDGGKWYRAAPELHDAA